MHISRYGTDSMYGRHERKEFAQYIENYWVQFKTSQS